MNCSCVSSKTTWKTRNDSSNVSTLLAPTNYRTNTPRPLIRNKNPTIRSRPRKTPPPLPPGHCETCYCRLTPQPPLLNLRPQPCIGQERGTQSARERTITEDECDGNTSVKSERLLREVHKKVDYVPRSVFMKRLKEEAHKNCTKVCCGGGFTQQRKVYEELAKLREGNQKQRTTVFDNEEARLRGGDDVCDCIKCEDEKTLVENTKKVLTIKDFRNENYFETHSSSNLHTHQEIGDHKCIHRFVLDDRMIPIPENPDPYGQSRCIICNKPMAEEDLSKKTVDCRVKQKNSKGTVTEKEFKGLMSLEPKRLYVPMKDEKVEVKVPLGLNVEEWYGRFKKLPRPRSSVALRYQKGVV